MKIFKHITTLAAIAAISAGCQDLDKVMTLAPSDVIPPVLNPLEETEIIITPLNMGEELTFTWDAADFGASTQISYALEASYAENAPVELFSGLTGTSTKVSYENLNSRLVLGLGAPVDTPVDIKYYISASIGTDFGKFYSEPIAVKMTVTAAEKEYPKVWIIGDYCGWNHANSQYLFSFSEDEINYEAIVDFGEKAANGFKVTGEAGWNNGNWGTDGDAPAADPEAASITLIDAGNSGNISAYSKRFYSLAFNKSTLELKNQMSFDQIGIIGDFNSWGEDVVMKFDTKKQRFYADVEILADGGLKFRLNGNWDISFGISAGSTSGVLDGGDNIPVTAGNYRVYVNLNNSKERTYEFNADDYGKEDEGPSTDPEEPEKAEWYIHGQTVATPDWGSTEMVSASSNIKAYKAAGVEVAANSEFLFKSGDETQWIGADKTFAGGASQYTVAVGSPFTTSADKVNAVIADAGTYDYWLLPEDNRAYVMAAGEKPEYVPDTYGLVGNITGWGDLGDFAMTEEGAYLVRRNVALTTASEFKIRFGNDWGGTANYGTESGGAIDINTAVPVVNAGNSQNMKVQIDGVYDIYLDLEDSNIYVMAAGTAPEK